MGDKGDPVAWGEVGQERTTLGGGEDVLLGACAGLCWTEGLIRVVQ